MVGNNQLSLTERQEVFDGLHIFYCPKMSSIARRKLHPVKDLITLIPSLWLFLFQTQRYVNLRLQANPASCL